jgi:hypothetical protein
VDLWNLAIEIEGHYPHLVRLFGEEKVDAGSLARMRSTHM